MKKPSLKINFAWAFVGNAVNALCNYLLLMILTKTAPVETVGLWGVAQAVTLPIATFFSLKLGTVNITDIHADYKPGHYVTARLLASLASVLVAVGIGLIFYSLTVACLISMMAMSYSIAEIRLYFISNIQKQERFGLVTVSQITVGVLTLLLFGLLFLLTKNLILAIMGTIISRGLVLFCYDIPMSAKVISNHDVSFPGYAPVWERSAVWSLLRRAAPLAIVATVGNISQNIPRLVMDKTLGRDAVGYFTALSMLLVVYTMVNAALGNAVLPRLSKYFVENTKAFIRLYIQLIILNLFLGLAFVAFIFLFGKPILSLLFTPEYARHKDVMVMLAFSSCILSVFGVSNWALNATRQFAIQVPIYIGTAMTSLIFSLLLIPKYGIMGGAYAFMASYLFGVSLSLLFIIKAIGRNRLNDRQT